MCAVVSSAILQTYVVSPVYNFVITFCHIFVKVNDAYVRFIAQSLSPFAASNNFGWEVNMLYT